jgi:hypothetical protein
MRATINLATLAAILAVPLLSAPAFAKRDAKDPRRLCREAIQKATGVSKDAKVSAKAIDRCVANGGYP